MAEQGVTAETKGKEGQAAPIPPLSARRDSRARLTASLVEKPSQSISQDEDASDDLSLPYATYADAFEQAQKTPLGKIVPQPVYVAQIERDRRTVTSTVPVRKTRGTLLSG